MAELDNELMATSTSISGSQQQQQQQMDFAHALESIHARQTERLAAAPPSAATAATTSTAAAVCSNCGTELSAGLALDACATQAVSHTALSSEGDSADHNNNTTSSPSTSTGSLPPHALERDLRLAAQLGQALLHEKHALEAAMGKTRRANDQLVERLARAVRDNKALQHRLDGTNGALDQADASNRSLVAALDDSRKTISRLSTDSARLLTTSSELRTARSSLQDVTHELAQARKEQARERRRADKLEKRNADLEHRLERAKRDLDEMRQETVLASSRRPSPNPANAAPATADASLLPPAYSSLSLASVQTDDVPPGGGELLAVVDSLVSENDRLRTETKELAELLEGARKHQTHAARSDSGSIVEDEDANKPQTLAQTQEPACQDDGADESHVSDVVPVATRSARPHHLRRLSLQTRLPGIASPELAGLPNSAPPTTASPEPALASSGPVAWPKTHRHHSRRSTSSSFYSVLDGSHTPILTPGPSHLEVLSEQRQSQDDADTGDQAPEPDTSAEFRTVPVGSRRHLRRAHSVDARAAQHERRGSNASSVLSLSASVAGLGIGFPPPPPVSHSRRQSLDLSASIISSQSQPHVRRHSLARSFTSADGAPTWQHVQQHALQRSRASRRSASIRSAPLASPHPGLEDIEDEEDDDHDEQAQEQARAEAQRRLEGGGQGQSERTRRVGESSEDSSDADKQDTFKAKRHQPRPLSLSLGPSLFPRSGGEGEMAPPSTTADENGQERRRSRSRHVSAGSNVSASRRVSMRGPPPVQSLTRDNSSLSSFSRLGGSVAVTRSATGATSLYSTALDGEHFTHQTSSSLSSLAAPMPQPTARSLSPSGAPDQQPAHVRSIALAQLLQSVTRLLGRLQQADVANLERRLKKHNLPGGVRHLAVSNLRDLVADIEALKPEFRRIAELEGRAVAREEHLPESTLGHPSPGAHFSHRMYGGTSPGAAAAAARVAAIDETVLLRRDFTSLVKLFRDLLFEISRLRALVNRVELDPAQAPLVSSMDLAHARSWQEVEQGVKDAEAQHATDLAAATASGAGGILAPLSRLLGRANVDADTPPAETLSTGEPTTAVTATHASSTPKLEGSSAISSATVNVEFAGDGRSRRTVTTPATTPEPRSPSSVASGRDYISSRVASPDSIPPVPPLPPIPPMPATEGEMPPPRTLARKKSGKEVRRDLNRIFAGSQQPSAGKPRKADAKAKPEPMPLPRTGGNPFGRLVSPFVGSLSAVARGQGVSATTNAVLDSIPHAPPAGMDKTAGSETRATLLERQLRPRGLSDSSIRSTFVAHANPAHRLITRATLAQHVHRPPEGPAPVTPTVEIEEVPARPVLAAHESLASDRMLRQLAGRNAVTRKPSQLHAPPSEQATPAAPMPIGGDEEHSQSAYNLFGFSSWVGGARNPSQSLAPQDVRYGKSLGV